MKRLLLLVLALVMLTGCGKQNAQTPETTLQTEPQPDPGWYMPNSDIEKETNGAVRAYKLPADKVTGICGINDKLLVKMENMLTVLSEDDCIVTAELTPKFEISDLQMTSLGVAYFDQSANEMVYLDQKLQEVNRISLPEAVDNTPVVSPDGSVIYYCVGGEIRGFDTNLNVARLVKSQLADSQTLEGIYFGDGMLKCVTQQENGNTSTVYLRTETGETLNTDDSLETLQTYGDNYIALRKDGTARQVIFGTKDTEPTGLALSQEVAVVSAANLSGVVTYKINEENTLLLDFYDCTTGKRTAQVTLSDTAAPVDCYADPWGRCLWIVAETAGVQTLYRWDCSKSAVTDETDYRATVYTRENPDTATLEILEQKAAALGKTQGIEITIFEDAVEQTGDFAVVPEHQTAAIDAVLKDLETVLPEYPEKFLRRSVHKDLHIGIVRSVDGGKEGAQFYKKSHAYILLPAGCDVRTELLKCMGYIVNSRVVSNTSMLDTWTKLNPEGFTYGEGKAEYLTGENRAFADMEAMTSVVEDRASIFRYAMEEGNKDMFASQTMQKKLKLLCEGIRKVWKWRKEEVSYPWEQYLNESLAYKK